MTQRCPRDGPPAVGAGRVRVRHDRAVTDTLPSTPAAQREFVGRGYDAISHAYRGDDGSPAGTTAEETGRYAGWLAELAGHLGEGASVLDLGCGAGVPAARWLVDAGLDTYLSWLGADGFPVVWSRSVPEGASGHALVLARKLAA